MNILPKISSVDVFNIKENQNSYTYINLNKDDNSWITFKDTNKSDNNILKDLIENKAYATMLLYLNENYILQVGMTNDIFKKSNSSISDYLKECENLLYKNTKIVEEAGIPLCNINGYKIFEGAGYILRGNGRKKIKESFNEIDINDITLDNIKSEYDIPIKGFVTCPECKSLFEEEDNTIEVEEDYNEPYSTIDNPYNEKIKTVTVNHIKCPYCGYEDESDNFNVAFTSDLYDAPNGEEYVPGIKSLYEDGEGTQCSDIAPKTDQDMNKRTTNKKKYYDILLSDFSESDNMNIINKGFLKNSEGQYQRGNYILVKEGETYLAIHKNKLKGGN